jgi:hypothetical protein
MQQNCLSRSAKLTKNMPGGQKFAAGSQKGSLEIISYSVSDLKRFWWRRYLTGAGAQVENLCHQ